MIIQKLKKNEGFTLSIETTVLEKAKGSIKLTSCPFRVKHITIILDRVFIIDF